MDLYFHQPSVFLLRRLHLKYHQGGHNQPKGETGPVTAVVLLDGLKPAHEVVDLILLHASPLQKFSELVGILEGLDQLFDVGIVCEVIGEVGDCLAVDFQLVQHIGKVDVRAFLDPKD